MAGDGRRRRRASTAGTLTNIHDLIDDLLELVLLRVPSPITLARAASTCRPWRRLIYSARFLRRHRSLHPPPVLGHFYAGGRTSFVPAPPPPGPRETAVDAICDRVSLDFLPGGYDDMELTDSRGGLLAFVRHDSASVVVCECDPLAGRFREVNLPAATPRASDSFLPCCLGAFLLDAGAGDGDTVVPSLSVSNFRVLCVPVASEDDLDRRLTARAFVFSARNSRWLLLSTTALQPRTCQIFVGRTEDSLVWSGADLKALHLDESTGEFSHFTLPMAGPPTIYHCRMNLRVVGRDDTGVMRLARIVGGSDLEVLRCEPGGGAAVTVERTVKLSHLTGITPWSDRSWYFLEMDAAVVPAGCVVVSTTDKCRWMFTVDVETMEAERGRKRDLYPRAVLPYELPWAMPAAIK
ncbi:unnamed protein product [Urochloa humidicola]